MFDNDQPDIFISHASEDKDAIARPLAVALRQRGLGVWFDEYVLKLGDNLRDVIDRGLRNARFGVVILSPAFFAKEWPKRELDALWARETKDGIKVILPIIHDMGYSDAVRYSPLLAGKLAVNSSRGIDFVANQIVDAIRALPAALGGEAEQRDAVTPATDSARHGSSLASVRRRYGRVIALAAIMLMIVWGTVAYLKGRFAAINKVTTVEQMAPIVDVTLTPSVIRPGETAELKWSTRNAASAFILPSVGFTTLQGSRRVSEPATYIIAASRSDGFSTVKTAKLKMAGDASANAVQRVLPAVEIGATHSKFGPPVLDWASTDATQIAIVPIIGFVPGTGHMEVFPKNTTTFTIIGTNSTGYHATASVTVQIMRWPLSEGKESFLIPTAGALRSLIVKSVRMQARTTAHGMPANAY